VKNGEILHRVKEDRNILRTIKRRLNGSEVEVTVHRDKFLQ